MHLQDQQPFRFCVGSHSSEHFQLLALSGRERLSSGYAFRLRLAGLGVDPRVDELVGSDARIDVLGMDQEPRHVHGVLSRIATLGAPRGVPLLEVTLVPRLWLLKRTKNSQIHQQKTVPEIVSAVLDRARVRHRWQLSRVYAVREYCVQYQETDYAFVTRLLAEEGIFFRFLQPAVAMDAQPSANDAEEVAFCDSTSHYAPLPGRTEIHRRDAGALDALEHVEDFAAGRRVREEHVRVLGYDYQRPAYTPLAEAHFDESQSTERLASYEHDRVLEPTLIPHHVAQLRLDERRRAASASSGRGNCRSFEPGRWFDLVDDAGARSGRYAIVEVHHHASQQLGAEHGGAPGEPSTYRNEFACVPENVPYRMRSRRRVRSQVFETAVVVGPPGEEIHTDELGRIKVQFPWDRHGASDEHSSCWIRPLQTWGGAGFGSQFIPRVGMEVLVGFVGGDTDRPTVLGCHYHGTNLPPFALPKEKTASGWRTRSTPGGEGSNELRFEDAKGAEQIYLHAERDFDVLVENDQSATIRGVQAVTVDSNRVVVVGGDNARLVSGNDVLFVSGNAVMEISGGQIIRIGGGAAANPRVQEAAARIRQTAGELLDAQADRASLEVLAHEAERTRDGQMLLEAERLQGEHQRAARILIRQVADLRAGQRDIDLGTASLLSNIDALQEQYLAGKLSSLPSSIIKDVAELRKRSQTLHDGLMQHIRESLEVREPIAALQQLARADDEAALARLQRTHETLALVDQFLVAFSGEPGGHAVGGGPMAPPASATRAVVFDKYREKAGDKEEDLNKKSVEGGSIADVNMAIELTSGAGIKLTCGGSTIEIMPGGINITSAGVVAINGKPINLNC